MKTLDDEHFGCRPLCLIFFIAVIMSEINPTDHKSITACHFPRDNMRAEADFRSGEIMDRANAIIVCILFWCLDEAGSEKYKGLL